MPVTVTPTVRAVGAVAANVGAISPGLPSGTVAGDLLVMFLETSNQAITVAGWTQLATDSPSSVASPATRLTVFWKVAVGGDATTTSDSGDHQVGRIIGITRDTFKVTAPIDASASGTRDPASTTATIPGPTTTQAQCLVLAASSHDLDTLTAAFSAPANANLTGVTLQINNSSDVGDGGGLGVVSGAKATAGAVGNTTLTVTSSVGGMISLAIAPRIRENDAISQVAVEAIYLPIPAGRESQVPVEVLVKGISASVITQLPVEVLAANVPAPNVRDMYWRVGVLDVPAGAGSQSIVVDNGLGDDALAVVFMGANFTQEDTVVTTAGTALFRGMATDQWDAPGTIIQSAAATGPGDQHRVESSAIMNISQAGSATVLYQADVTSLDEDGFTLSWATGAAGYKVVYAIMFKAQQCVGHIGLVNGTLADVGFKAGGSLLHGAWAGPVISGNNRSQEWYGGGSYPGTASGDWAGAGLAVQCFPTSQSQQFQQYLDSMDPTILTVTAQHFTGPFLTGSNLKAYPTDLHDVGNEDFVFTGDGTNGGMVMFWDDEDNRCGYATPDGTAAGVDSVTLPFDPGMVLGYTTSDEPRQQGTGGRGAVGFMLVGYDSDAATMFQWGAVVDRINPGAIQSFSVIPTQVHDTSVQSMTMQLRPLGFDTTTVDDDVTTRNYIYHAFGHPQLLPLPVTPGIWLPQQYRMWRQPRLRV